MKPIGALLLLFVGLGILGRNKYNAWVRLLLIVGIGVIVLYETFH